ncbi:MAG: response regulator transcription factor [Bacteroidota bacterium]
MRIIIADDHELIRNGIKATLDNLDNIQLIGEAGDGPDALEVIRSKEPDLAILDISMPGLTGIEVLSQLAKDGATTKVIMLTMHSDYQYVDKCLELGAKGYVAKGDAGTDMLDAIKHVTEGKIFFSSSIQAVVLENFAQGSGKKGTDEEEVHVTKREKEVLKMVGEGLTSAQIAETLFVSPRTVDTHRANLMRKLEVKNAVELVIKARDMKLIDP